MSEPAFVCPFCLAKSFHPEDIANRYCGNCHMFTGSESMLKMREFVTSTPCPNCGERTLQVALLDRYFAHPLGEFSLAGQQMKVSATKRKWPYAVCSRPECDFVKAASTD